MNSDQICLWQPPYWRSSGANAPALATRGTRVFVPVAGMADAGWYAMYDVGVHDVGGGDTGVRGWDVQRCALAKVMTGQLHHSCINAGNTASLTFTTGYNAWGNRNSDNLGLRAFYGYGNEEAGASVTLAVPVGTTRIYLLGYSSPGNQPAMPITLSAGSGGTVLKPTVCFDSDATEDFPEDWSMSNNGAMWPEKFYIKIAAHSTGFGAGATLTIGPTLGKSATLLGILTIQDGSGPTTPDLGVIDPDTLDTSLLGYGIDHMVLRYKVTDSAHRWWGRGHWWAKNTVINGPAGPTLHYDLAGTLTAYAPADYTDVRTPTSRFVMGFYGDAVGNDSATELGDGTQITLGTWRDWQAFSVSGLERWGKLTVGAAGAAAGFTLEGTLDGGYANITAFGQYWKQARSVPSNLTPVAITFGRDYATVIGRDSTLQLYSPSLVANIICLSGVLSVTGVTKASEQPIVSLTERNLGLDDIKLYGVVAGEADVVLAEGDEITGRTLIQFCGRSSLEFAGSIAVVN